MSYESNAIMLVKKRLEKQNYLMRQILDEMKISNYLKMAEYNKKYSTTLNMEDLRSLILSMK